VLEEYTRPARLRRGGEIKTMPALSEVEPIDAPEVGRLEAFNTDGLRTLLGSFDWPEMKEKTLRWPGHAKKAGLLRELGFLSPDPVGDSGTPAIRLTEEVLRRAWRYQPGEQEFTCMRVDVGGLRGGRHVMLRGELLDYTDSAGNMSMARTTGLPAVAAAILLVNGKLEAWLPGAAEPGNATSGVVCPEWLGGTRSFEFIENYLGAAGIRIDYSEVAS
jgi:saccharopine dehydrogenase-like NADP-dependent oxidoreductase